MVSQVAGGGVQAQEKGSYFTNSMALTRAHSSVYVCRAVQVEFDFTGWDVGGDNNGLHVSMVRLHPSRCKHGLFVSDG
jgi:hypothetical protein